jgi:hypothetical protein
LFTLRRRDAAEGFFWHYPALNRFLSFPAITLQTRLMQRSVVMLLLVCSTLFIATGASVAQSAPKKRTAKIDQSEKPPFVGMTKAQALARYGEPKTHTITEKGEQWVYLLNYGEVLGKAFIPFNFKVTPIRTGVLTFGPDGKVKEFRWDAETKG